MKHSKIRSTSSSSNSHRWSQHRLLHLRLSSLAASLTLALLCAYPAQAQESESSQQTTSGSRTLTCAPAAPYVDGSTTVAFTRDCQHPEQLWISVIDGASAKLRIGAYSLTHPDIIAAIDQAELRGVDVVGATDRTEVRSIGAQRDAIHKLQADGGTWFWDTHAGLMHLKVVDADDQVLVTGSFNPTVSAATTNDENALKLDDPELASQYGALIDQMQADTTHFAPVP